MTIDTNDDLYTLYNKLLKDTKKDSSTDTSTPIKNLHNINNDTSYDTSYDDEDEDVFYVDDDDDNEDVDSSRIMQDKKEQNKADKNLFISFFTNIGTQLSSLIKQPLFSKNTNKLMMQQLVESKIFSEVFIAMDHGNTLTKKMDKKFYNDFLELLWTTKTDALYMFELILSNHTIPVEFSLPNKYLVALLYSEQGGLLKFIGSDEPFTHLISTKNKFSKLHTEYPHLCRFVQQSLNNKDVQKDMLSFWTNALNECSRLPVNELFYYTKDVTKKSFPHAYASFDIISYSHSDFSTSLSMIYKTCPFSEYLKHIKLLEGIVNNLDTFTKNKENSRELAYRYNWNKTTGEVFVDIKNTMQSLIKTIYNDDLNNLYINPANKNNNTKITHETLKKENEMEASIPKNIQDIISNIHNTYRIFSENIPSQHHIETDKIRNIVENRIPELVNQYLLINKTSRTTIENDNGKNASNILYNCLHNFEITINHMIQTIDESHLASLSAMERYTLELKNEAMSHCDYISANKNALQKNQDDNREVLLEKEINSNDIDESSKKNFKKFRINKF